MHLHGTDALDSVKIKVAEPAIGSSQAEVSIKIEIGDSMLKFDVRVSTPEELIFAEFSAEDDAPLQESKSMESAALSESWESYGAIWAVCV